MHILNVMSIEEYNCSLWVGLGRLCRVSMEDWIRSADHTPRRCKLCAISPRCREICFSASHSGSSASTRARFRAYLCRRLYTPLGAWDFVALKGPGIAILVRITCQGKITFWKISYTRNFWYLPQRPQCEECPLIAAKADEIDSPSRWHPAVQGRQMPDKDNRKNNGMYMFRRNVQGHKGDSSENLALI